MERLIEAGYSIAHYVFVALAGAVGILVRKVFTAEKKIELLEQHLISRDKQREEDREALVELRDDVKEIRSWIMEKAK
jgi:hypothetical protein